MPNQPQNLKKAIEEALESYKTPSFNQKASGVSRPAPAFFMDCAGELLSLLFKGLK